jgi:hypothetical protein
MPVVLISLLLLFAAAAVTRAATKMSVCPLNADENDDKKSKDSRLN